MLYVVGLVTVFNHTAPVKKVYCKLVNPPPFPDTMVTLVSQRPLPNPVGPPAP